MEVQSINGQQFIPAKTITKSKSYRFDLSPSSITATAISYDFVTGWTFSLDDESGCEVVYSATEIKARIESGAIWKKLG